MKVAILLHMHQPPYGLKKGKMVYYSMPWVMTHLIREYHDVARALSFIENPILTINFSGSLIEQIMDYIEGRATDRFIEIFKKKPEDMEPEERVFLLQNFFSVNFERRIKPFRKYFELYVKRGSGDVNDKAGRFSSQDLRDLQVLFFLSQISVFYQKEDPEIIDLIKKGRGFDERDKEILLEKMVEIAKRVVSLYRELRSRGLAISFTPMYHPILPLIYSISIARESNPHCELPEAVFSAPSDVEEHIIAGRQTVEKVFGKVRGSWPAEGSVSVDTIKKFGSLGVEWIATDEEILHRTLGKIRRDEYFAGEHVYRGYQIHRVKVFFRDRILSDLIGFVYSRWSTERAVNDFLARLSRIEKEFPQAIVSVILDGENPWEYYPDGGTEFLPLLIESISRDFELAVFDELEADLELSRVHPGSWINGDFNTWICDHEKNIAWTYLSRVKNQVYNLLRDSYEAKVEWLKAEASDWFWWLGEGHPSVYAPEFDRIFRGHLKKIFEILQLEPPEFLDIPIKSSGSSAGIIPPWMYSSPVIDGRITNYFEWLGAGRIKPWRSTMSMTSDPLEEILYIFDENNLYLLLDFGNGRADDLISEFSIEIEISTSRGKRVFRISSAENNEGEIRWSAGKKLEIAIDRKLLNGSETPALRVTLYRGQNPAFVYPEEGFYILKPTKYDPDAIYW